MKKIFLVFGLIGATSGYAVQDGGVSGHIKCPEGCTPAIVYNDAGTAGTLYCADANGKYCPDSGLDINQNVHSIKPAIKPMHVSQQSVNSKVQKKHSAEFSRSATSTPKMIKKIVYEQVVEEDEE